MPSNDTGSILDSLLDSVNLESDDEMPWEPGYELTVSAWGGVRNHENRRITIAPNGYSSHVSSNLDTWITGDYNISYDQSVSFTLSKNDDNANTVENPGEVNWGEDKLTVNGNTFITFHERTYLMTGFIHRKWQGGVMRMSGLEGIICGGATVRVIAGASLTLSALASGDIYGGAGRVAATRLHITALTYRSANVTSWAMGAWIRSTTIRVVPPLTPPAEGGIAKKDWALKVGAAIAPFAAVIAGALMAPLALIMLILKIKSGFKAFNAQYPPRVRNTNAGATQQVTASDTVA